MEKTGCDGEEEKPRGRGGGGRDAGDGGLLLAIISTKFRVLVKQLWHFGDAHI